MTRIALMATCLCATLMACEPLTNAAPASNSGSNDLVFEGKDGKK